MSARRALLLAVWLAAIGLGWLVMPASAQSWPAASSMTNDPSGPPTHAWVIIPQGTTAGPGISSTPPSAAAAPPTAAASAAAPAWYLLHLPPRRAAPVAGSRGTPGGTVRVAATIPELPAGLAAVDNRVYLVVESMPEPGRHQSPAPGRDPIRRVLSMAAVPAGVSDLWTFEPADRFKNVPAIPGPGRLVGFAGSPRGPVALLDRAPADHQHGEHPDTGGVRPRYELLLLTDQAWEPLPMPATLADRTDLVGLAAIRRGVGVISNDGPGQGGVWTAIWPAGSSSPGHVVWTYQNLQTVPRRGPATEPAGIMQAGGVWIRSSRADTTLTLQSSEGGHWFDLASVPQVSGGAAVAPLDDVGRIAVIWRGPGPVPAPATPPTSAPAAGKPAPAYEMQEFSAYTGRVFYTGPARAKGPISWADFRLLSFVLLGVMALVLVIVVRAERPESPVVLPEGASLAEPGQRMVAGMLDVVISGSATLWTLDVPWREALNPIWLLSTPGELTLLAWIMTGLLLSTLTEAWFGASPAKALIGTLVVRCRPMDAGSKAASKTADTADAEVRPRSRGIGVRAALTRNAIKWLLPPVGVVGLLTQDCRHLGDTLAGTAVIRRDGVRPKE